MGYLICGVDEVGRGALAGPLIAVAAMFDVEYTTNWATHTSPIKGVDDSKAFSGHSKRTEVFHRILRHEVTVDFGIGYVSVEEINKDGIDYANQMAFYRAWRDLKCQPNFILVDGDMNCPGWSYQHQRAQPKADGMWWPVGAASILAKVIRDNYMVEIGLDFLHYKWSQNAGYGTKDHVSAIRHFGPSPHHRSHFIRNIAKGSHDRVPAASP